MQSKEELEKARERVIEAISQNMNLYGVTPSVGRLWGLLYFQNQPMTLDEMKNELGMSKTSMSTSVRNLMDLHMVDKVWKKGNRKDLYVAEEDWYQTFIDFFTIKWRNGVQINVSAIEKSLRELNLLLEKPELTEEFINEIKSDIEKLHQSLEYYGWLNRLVDSFETHEIFDFIPKKPIDHTK
ncbi:choline uptake/conversion transcriptional regulator CudC [Metabacillus bambusae]|uniref:HTH-type transcriptional regulator n=1 Tax=Metabacillus bambusae TaxID=2795218 RepID=A0ABS3MWS9_9BACI|nr:GbsR/MarR family transcriptional regulator [Metabacillus bambusae]MBO1510128.1 GbsR/MarR family transcriptional regulator [Metabacillus bambusae]